MTKHLFNIWEPFRQNLIARHQFYIEQATKRLLSQFPNIEQEATEYEEKYLEKISQHFDPDKHDEGDLYEEVENEGMEFYEMLEDMLSRTRLSVIAGMYHEWEKQLKDWMTGEIIKWHTGQEVKKAVWKVNFPNTIDFLEACGWSIRTKDYYQSLDRCRLVVNVYKHGDGDSLDDIKEQYPEFIESSGNDEYRPLELKYSDFTNLVIKEEHIEEFSNAIIAFWKDVPTNIFVEDSIIFPKWFEKARKKDCEEANS